MGAGEYWITIEFKPVGQPGDLADSSYLVSGSSTMEPAINFTRNGALSVHLKFAGDSDEEAELVAQQRMCSILSPSRYRFVGIKSAPAISNPPGGTFGKAEFRSAAERIVSRRSAAGRLVGTVVFCDIVGSTRLIGELGDQPWKELLEQFRTGVRETVANHAGRELKTTRDGFLLYWAGLDATRAMEAMLRVRERARTLGIELRIGAHWGEFQPITGDVAGIEIHIASRVIGHAGEGQLLVTGSVLDLLDTERFRIGSRHDFRLRDVIPERWSTTRRGSRTALAGCRPRHGLSESGASVATLRWSFSVSRAQDGEEPTNNRHAT